MQQGRPGVADRVLTPTRGTARIRGRVVAQDTGRPLRGAAVVVASANVSRAATTNKDGMFGWNDLPAGNYRIRAAYPGYVALEFGERAGEGGGRDIAVADKDLFDKANFVLPRGGVITGRIMDEAGEPIEGVKVIPMTLEYVGGTPRLVPVGPPVAAKRSNDLGRFRIFGLQPGEYYVAATPGAFNSAAPPNGDMASGYIVTYYPGDDQVANAQLVGVAAAQETPVDFALVASPTFAFFGTAVYPSGDPVVGATVVLTPGMNAAIAVEAQATTAGDGSFGFSGLAPGPYLLTLQPLPAPAQPTLASMLGRTPRSFGSVVVSVTARTPEVVLQGRPGRSTRGQVVIDGGQQIDLRTVKIATRAVDFARSPLAADLPSAVRADGLFDLVDQWGPRVLEVLAPPGWGLKAVRLAGIDATDRPIDFDREAGTLQVVITNQVSDISGNVTDEGHAAAYAPVIVFPENRDKWDFQSRFIRLVTADENGHFTAPPMPPGEYRAIALARLRSGTSWQRPQVLESLMRDSARITLREADHASVDLRVVRPR